MPLPKVQCVICTELPFDDASANKTMEKTGRPHILQVSLLLVWDPLLIMLCDPFPRYSYAQSHPFYFFADVGYHFCRMKSAEA